jgi:hypothetical protein
MVRKRAMSLSLYKKPEDEYGLLLYAMQRDPSALQRHLDAGHGINTLDSQGVNLLHRACSPDVEALSKGSDTLVKAAAVGWC